MREVVGWLVARGEERGRGWSPWGSSNVGGISQEDVEGWRVEAVGEEEWEGHQLLKYVYSSILYYVCVYW